MPLNEREGVAPIYDGITGSVVFCTFSAGLDSLEFLAARHRFRGFHRVAISRPDPSVGVKRDVSNCRRYTFPIKIIKKMDIFLVISLFYFIN